MLRFVPAKIASNLANELSTLARSSLVLPAMFGSKNGISTFLSDIGSSCSENKERLENARLGRSIEVSPADCVVASMWLTRLSRNELFLYGDTCNLGTVAIVRGGVRNVDLGGLSIARNRNDLSSYGEGASGSNFAFSLGEVGGKLLFVIAERRRDVGVDLDRPGVDGVVCGVGALELFCVREAREGGVRLRILGGLSLGRRRKERSSYGDGMSGSELARSLGEDGGRLLFVMADRRGEDGVLLMISFIFQQLCSLR